MAVCNTIGIEAAELANGLVNPARVSMAAASAKAAGLLEKAEELLGRNASKIPSAGTSEIGPWGKGVRNVVEGVPFTQCGNGSCVSATAQILTKGTVTEQQALSRLGEWADPTRLPSLLNELAPSSLPWKGGYFANAEDALRIASRGEMGAVLQSPGQAAHMVTIAPISEASGMFRVYDTGVGKTYDVTSDWIKKFVSGGVWK